MKKAFSIVSATMFAVLYPFCMISSSYSVKNYYFGFHSTAFIYIRYLIIFTIMLILAYLNRKNRRLMCIYVPAVMIIVAAAAYVDYFITLKLLYNYGYLLWFGVVYSVTNAGVFFGIMLSDADYKEDFYKRLWKAYIPMFILIFYVAFIRQPESYALTVNKTLGNGTLKYFKAVFKDPSNNLYTSLVCFGNIFIFIPIPFIFYAFKKPPAALAIAIGIACPLLVEGYQYIFRCGDVDVDDLLLNFTGYIIGYIIADIFYKKTVSPENG